MKQFSLIALFGFTLFTSGMMPVRYDGVSYNLNDTGGMSVFRAEGVRIEQIEIPDFILRKGKSFSVNRISDYAFSGQKHLKKVVVSDSVMYIGNGVFSNCVQLSEISFPAELSIINYGLLSGCSNLKSVNIPQNIVSIYGNAFENCTSLSVIELPCSLKKIGDRAFDGCINLSNVYVKWNDPSGVICGYRPFGHDISLVAK